MSLKGTTALIRMAQNPQCEVLGAMVMEEGSEKRFYEQVVGHPYDREFGERQSSIRRGNKFEQNAYGGDARLLREALSDIVGLGADNIRVRNLMDDHPGSKEDARLARFKVTRGILKSSIHAGEDVPHILIQPQLLIPTEPGPRPYFFVSPDLLVWSHRHGLYLPGDLKSFIVRENEVAKADLARVRLQLGAHLLALRYEYHQVSPDILVPAKGLLIFSKPNGLRPHEPRLEEIGGAVEAIRKAIGAFLQHRARIEELRAGAAPHTVVAELRPNFQEACLATCVMAQQCRQRVTGMAADLGDQAIQVLGDMPLDRLTALMTGRVVPANDHERSITVQLQRIAAENGLGAA